MSFEHNKRRDSDLHVIRLMLEKALHLITKAEAEDFTVPKAELAAAAVRDIGVALRLAKKASRLSRGRR